MRPVQRGRRPSDLWKRVLLPALLVLAVSAPHQALAAPQMSGPPPVGSAAAAPAPAGAVFTIAPSGSAPLPVGSASASAPADSGAAAAAPVIPLTDAAGSVESKQKDSPSNPEVQATALPSVGGRRVRGYAKAGVWEMGGALSFITGKSLQQVGLAPTAGYFVIDYVEISLLPQFDYAQTAGSSGKTRLVLLVEPSWHMQLKGALFLFFGSGFGTAYEKASGTGLALAPRTGINVLIGGNGVVNVGFEYVYAASPKAAPKDRDNATPGLRAGYTVAW